mgnify:CR=1 FL=1
MRQTWLRDDCLSFVGRFDCAQDGTDNVLRNMPLPDAQHFQAAPR